MLPGKIKIYDIKISIIKCMKKTWRKDTSFSTVISRVDKKPFRLQVRFTSTTSRQLIYLRAESYVIC